MMNIEWIHLHNLLSKANERAVESRKIYQKLDEALRRELGRVIERGPLQGERPADDELDQYEEVRIPEMDDTELANATPMHPSLGVMAGVPAGERLAPRRYVTRWRKILRRNPTDEREVFTYFGAHLHDLCTPGTPLAKQFKTGPSVAMIDRVNEWIAQKQMAYAAKDASKEAETRRTESKKRPKQQKPLAEYLQCEDRQRLIGRIGEVIRDAGPKKVATIIRTLSDMGVLNIGTGEYARLVAALNTTYDTRYCHRNINAYITGQRSQYITGDDLQIIKNLMQTS